jgi:hypothetical protein
MAFKQIKSEGKNLLTAEDVEFSEWLKKEYNIPLSTARLMAVSRSNKEKGIMMMLREEMPNISLEELTKLVTEVPFHRLVNNIRTLEEKGADLSKFTTFDELSLPHKEFMGKEKKETEELSKSIEKELTSKQNAEFADWLVKEFGMPEGRARTATLLYSPGKKELMVLFKKEAPKASFKGLCRALDGNSYEKLLENARTLEENKIPLSKGLSVIAANPRSLRENIRLLNEYGVPLLNSLDILRSSYITVEDNLKLLKEHKIPPAKAATILKMKSTWLRENLRIFEENHIPVARSPSALGANPEYIRENIRVLKEHHVNLSNSISVLRSNPLELKENIKTLEEHNIYFSNSPSALRNHPARLKEAIQILEEHQIPPRKVLDISPINPARMREDIKILEEHKITLAEFKRIYLLSLPPERFSKVLDAPAKELGESPFRYEFSDREYFYYLIKRFRPEEQAAFREIGERLESESELTKKKLKEIFNKHVKGEDDAVEGRLGNILHSLVKDGALKRENTAEKKEHSKETV